jgi:NADH-quinone oxidoreductase subunit M
MGVPPMSELPVLSLVTFTPFVGALLLFALRDDLRRWGRRWGLGFSGLALAQVVWLAFNFDSGSGALQFVERQPWVPVLGVEYFVGVDGLGLLMVLLTAVVVPFSLLVGGRSSSDHPRYFALVLSLETGLFGTFTALNFFHWFLFWELSLVPAFFLIKLWGGPRRSAAASQFFLYTLVGSVTLLLGFVALYLAHGTFDFLDLAELARQGSLTEPLAGKLGWLGGSGERLGLLVFLGILLGFAVKVPLLPFHTWLPLAYAEAPGPITMLLTGLMSKMGVYGLLRLLLPLFPDYLAALQTPLLALAVATVVFAAAAAYVQTDLKRMLAYSSINHLGYCWLAIFALAGAGAAPVERAAALNGVLLQMFNHGLTAATLFGLLHLLEQRSAGARDVGEFGGLRQVAPVFTGLMGIALFASLGLPGLNGFVGEFLIFKGTFGLVSWAAVAALPGLLITAVFILGLMQRVFHGPVAGRSAGFVDLSPGERMVLAPAIALMFVLGIAPQLAVGLFNRTVVQMIAQLSA